MITSKSKGFFAHSAQPPFSFLTLVFAIVLAQVIQAKEIAQYGIRHYDKSQGLSASTILDISQSEDGYLWISTYDGLNRFNGYEFKIFDQKTTPILENDSFTKVHHSGDHKLWLGTLGGGIYVFEDVNLKTEWKKARLPNVFVNDIIEDSDGTIWVGSRKGLYRFKNEKWSHGINADQLTTESIQGLCIGKPDEIYIATNSGLFLMKGNKLLRIEGDLPSEFSIDCMEYSNESGLWIGTFLSGLYNISPNEHQVKKIETHLSGESIGDILFDQRGNLWIGGREGISRIGPDGQSSYKLKGQMVYNLQIDKEGGIWVGTYLHGLYRLGENLFSSFRSHERYEESLVGRAIYERNGEILVGSNMGFYTIEKGYLEKASGLEEFEGKLIRSIGEAKDGTWVATQLDGVAHLSNDNKVTWFRTSEGLGSLTVRSVYEDNSGALWIGGAKGLEKLVDGKVEKIGAIGELPILCIIPISKGRLFIGTDGAGFFIIGDNGIQQYCRKNGLPADIVFFCLEDSEGDLWVTASGAGIIRVRGAQISSLTSQQNLPSESLFYMIEDSEGYFWCGSNIGIFQVQKKQIHEVLSGEISNIDYKLYDTFDGINKGGITNVTLPYVDSVGHFWFPTISGVTTVDPKNQNEHIVHPSIKIETVSTDFVPEINLDSENLTFKAGTRRFTFQYAGLSLQSPEKIEYEVSLKGFEKEWIDVGSRREMTYTNLKPGSYSFDVRIKDSIPEHLRQHAQVSFTLTPYFYQTKWFLACSIAFLILLVIFTIKTRTDHLRANQAKLQALVKQRTTELEEALAQANEDRLAAQSANTSKSRFLATISHEFRNPMNGIVGITDLFQGTPLTEEQENYVDIIQSSSVSLLTLLNDLLDYSKIEANKLELEKVEFSLEDVIKESASLLKNQFREKNLSFNSEIEADIPQKLFGDPLRIRQIILNLLSNAVKFTDEGGVSVKAALKNETEETITLIVQVTDTGIGIKPEFLERLFGEYEQETQSVAREHGGTGLGLSICKELVHLMDGEIRASSELTKGSTFKFEVELGKVQ